MQKRFLIVYVAIVATLSLAAQSISGVVNAYSPVTGIGCDYVVATNPSLFSIGDRVLLIQMQGATVATANNSTFGSVTSYNDAGHYEFANVVSMVGNSVHFQFGIVNTYTPATGRVQLVRVPQYNNATITGPLACTPWNGIIGGVLVIEVSGTLTMNDKIDVSGNGFRGGTQCTNPDGACGSGYTDYSYQVTSGFGAQKGEGICVPQVAMDGGRGAWANGGGGGNKHNSGGGGGSNYSAGGVGGSQANFCPSTPVGGVGGYAMTYTWPIFMGGGGGCSDNNNQVGTPGMNGGGIIIIKASTLVGNNDSIISNGLSCGIILNNIGDGAGGGGAGGTILLSVGNYSSGVVVQANGGDGGDQNTSYGACFGPGGGGGVGAVWFSQASLPGSVTVATNAGAAGIDLNPNSSCYLQSYGAAAGASASGQLFNLSLPEGTVPGPIVNLGNDSSYCSGTITLNAGNPGFNYLWSTGATTQQINVTAGGTYWVTITDPTGGCTSTDTIIFSGSGLTVNLGADTIICGGNQLTLNAGNSASSYVWNTGDTTSVITATTSGTYSVIITNAQGCTGSDAISINFQPPLQVELGNDSVYCNGTIALNAGNPGCTYLWNTGSNSQLIGISSGGTYWVIVATPAGCIASDTITFQSALQVSLGGDIIDCIGNPVTLTASGTATSYLWSTGATSNSIVVMTAGQYWVMGSDSFCSSTDTINVILQMLTVNLGPDIVTCDSVMNLYSPITGDTYQWSTGETTSSMLVSTPGTYSLTVTSGNCTGSDVVNIVFAGSMNTVDFPNVFTPNASGVNDYFIPLLPVSTEIDLQIFDRWGCEVFHQVAINPSWDGTASDGKDVPVGVYYWIARYKTGCIIVENGIQTGFVTILR